MLPFLPESSRLSLSGGAVVPSWRGAWESVPGQIALEWAMRWYRAERRELVPFLPFLPFLPVVLCARRLSSTALNERRRRAGGWIAGARECARRGLRDRRASRERAEPGRPPRRRRRNSWGAGAPPG